VRPTETEAETETEAKTEAETEAETETETEAEAEAETEAEAGDRRRDPRRWGAGPQREERDVEAGRRSRAAGAAGRMFRRSADPSEIGAIWGGLAAPSCGHRHALASTRWWLGTSAGFIVPGSTVADRLAAMRAELLTVLALAAACGSNTVGADGPCDVNPPDPACSLDCDGNDSACPLGFYCGPVDTCTADCTQGGSECGSGFECDPRGHCVRTGSGGDGGTSPDGDECPSVTVTPMATTPTVHLVIDRSGSMDQSFGGTSRWAAVRTALTGTSGVVTQLQDRVFFGATTYSSDRSGTCPDVRSTPTRMLNNQAAIDTLLRDNLLTDTPTGESLRPIIDGLIATPPPAGSTPILLLATDGLPDTCADIDENGNIVAQNLTISETQRAFTAGIKTYILSVGNQVGDTHLQRVANAGVGADVATGTSPFYKANDPAQLADQLRSIITGALSCTLDLNGTIQNRQQAEESGIVTLGGTRLMFGTDWRFVDDDTIELLGTACTNFRAGGATLSATFECGVIVE
jgi:hypothetical protein